MIHVGQIWRSMILWFPKNILPKTWFKRNKPQKNMFDTPGTARKLLDSPSLHTLITGIKRYTRTKSSINHHFFSPICYFWNFFSHHFSFQNQKTPVRVPAPFSLAKPLFGCRVPVPLPWPGSTPPRRCELHRSRGHRSPGSWDGRSTAPWH